jgi:protein-disulfide isomerase
MADPEEGAVCGVDGCVEPARARAIPPVASTEPKLAISIVSDAICPWCYVGKRRFEKAVAALKLNGRVRVIWRPFELNPDMPKDGI